MLSKLKQWWGREVLPFNHNPKPDPEWVRPHAPLPPLKKPLPMPSVLAPAEEETLRLQLAKARHEIGVLHRRVQRLKDTWPALYKQFFTPEGEAALDPEAPAVRTRRKK